MKTSKSILEVLGISQADMVLLLKVTRSQLAMYELGKRDLPVLAKVQLAAMLQQVHETASQKLIPE